MGNKCIEGLFDSPYLLQYEKAVVKPKLEISKTIKDSIDYKNMSLRKIDNNINNLGLDKYKASYTQLCRVTSGENYNINTLLKLLDALDLEIKIVKK